VLQIALAALWESWGIRPAAVVGHSVGEVAAAYVGGALSLQDAVCVIHARSSTLPAIEGAGRMLAANIGREAVAPLLAGRESAVCIAAVNSPFSLTLSGDAGELQIIAEELERRGIFHRFLNVEVPYHSPAADALTGPIRRAVSGVKAQPARLPIYSTVTGALAATGEFGPEYWPKNVRQPVLFESAIQRILEDGHRLFLELGPHPVLGVSMAQCAESAGVSAITLSSLRRGQSERATLLKTASALYSRYTE
jgi:acyl transferase domain-containing protein